MSEEIRDVDEETRERAGDVVAVRLEQIERSLVEISRYLKDHNRPADLRVIVLEQGRPVYRDDVGDALAARSIGVINPSPQEVRIGVGGISTSDSGRAIPVPAAGAMVMPVAAQDLEIGATAADLAAGPIVVYLLRFKTVQPFFMGTIS